MGSTWGSRPVTRVMMSSRLSLTRRMYPSRTVGVMANPRRQKMRLPFVVSTDKIASTGTSVSSRHMSPSSTGEPISGTGSWGTTGALGQMWVHTTTSPWIRSPCARISASFSPAASAQRAPSPSETKPVTAGRAPSPPNRPIMPMVGAGPPADLPFSPGMQTRMKSVSPLCP